MTHVRILKDHSHDHVPPVVPGTIVDARLMQLFGEVEAWYNHPEAGEEWVSYEGDFEVVEDD